MADITMCTQTQCPFSGHCYRAQAVPSEQQSMAAFDLVVEGGVVKCAHYIPTSQDPSRVWYSDYQGWGD